MLYSQIKEVKSAVTGPCYVGADRSKLSATAQKKMQPLVAYLGKKDFLMGDSMCFLDFQFIELCEFVEWITDNEFFQKNKGVGRFVKRIKTIRQIKRYLKSDRFFSEPFNNKIAKINNISNEKLYKELPTAQPKA